MSNSFGVKLHGKSVAINGVEIPNVSSVHFSESKEQMARTIVEIDGDFDFEGLSGVEFVFHPSSIREAIELLSFYAKLDEDFARKFNGIIRDVIEDYSDSSLKNMRLASEVLARLVDEL